VRHQPRGPQRLLQDAVSLSQGVWLDRHWSARYGAKYNGWPAVGFGEMEEEEKKMVHISLLIKALIKTKPVLKAKLAGDFDGMLLKS
jgi:hypothetical protein